MLSSAFVRPTAHDALMSIDLGGYSRTVGNSEMIRLSSRFDSRKRWFESRTPAPSLLPDTAQSAPCSLPNTSLLFIASFEGILEKLATFIDSVGFARPLSLFFSLLSAGCGKDPRWTTWLLPSYFNNLVIYTPTCNGQLRAMPIQLLRTRTNTWPSPRQSPVVLLGEPISWGAC